jgi:hypothetical protein
LDNAKNTLDDTTKAMREPVLDAVNKAGGVKTKRVLDNLDNLGSSPDVIGDPSMYRAVSRAKRQVLMLDRDGEINAKAIYATRKSINKAVAKAAEATEGTATARDYKKMGYITHQIQLAIDGAIESKASEIGLGGKWGEYLKTHWEGMKLIEAHELRAEFASEMAKQVKPLGSSIVPGELPHPPTLLNRKMMFVNWGLRLLGSDANTPVVQELTSKLTDPREFAKLLQRPAKDPLKVLTMEAMRRGSIAAGVSYTAQSEKSE